MNQNKDYYDCPSCGDAIPFNQQSSVYQSMMGHTCYGHVKPANIRRMIQEELERALKKETK